MCPEKRAGRLIELPSFRDNVMHTGSETIQLAALCNRLDSRNLLARLVGLLRDDGTG